MWDMFKEAAIGFTTGKLFAKPSMAYGMLAAGVGITAALFIAAFKLGLPLYAAVALAAFVGGAIQPRLFKNLKYR